MSASPSDYLSDCPIIDFGSRNVSHLAFELAARDALATARRCFEFVRDEIRHSWDFELNPVTCRASDVLTHRTGYCYAKSHLLAALLRANQIPAGLCYQRLRVSEESPLCCIHGLNAIYLEEFGWYRVDARGNRSDVDAQFCPPVEQLAFPTLESVEFDIPGIHVSPRTDVVDCLSTFRTWDAVANNLPDLAVDESIPD